MGGGTTVDNELDEAGNIQLENVIRDGGGGQSAAKIPTERRGAKSGAAEERANIVGGTASGHATSSNSRWFIRGSTVFKVKVG